ncbi:MAG: hypothetical protein MJ092_08400 [Lachnospiraceae bacterium]|nr:hypothetical protein [Lachnospiraceae bacterium]
MKKKQFLSAILAVIILVFLSFPSYAAIIPQSHNSEEQIMRAEQTKWYFRVYNGKLQKRLWSLTEGKWLTDWMDVT